MTESPASASERGQRIGETFGELSEEIAALVREELERARSDITARAVEAGKGSGYLAVAAAFALAASATTLSLPAFVLRRMFPAEATALIVAGAYGGIAYALGRRALERIQRAAPVAVEERIDEKKQDFADSLKEQLPGSGD